jgi:hypothetical protein
LKNQPRSTQIEQKKKKEFDLLVGKFPPNLNYRLFWKSISFMAAALPHAQALEAALTFLSAESGHEVELTKLRSATQKSDGSVIFQLVVCQGDACAMEMVKATPSANGSYTVTRISEESENTTNANSKALPMPSADQKWMIYSIHDCPYCTRAKAELKSRNEQFIEINCDEVDGGKKHAADQLAK